MSENFFLLLSIKSFFSTDRSSSKAVIGEGGSGGALAIGMGDKILMKQYSKQFGVLQVNLDGRRKQFGLWDRVLHRISIRRSWAYWVGLGSHIVKILPYFEKDYHVHFFMHKFHTEPGPAARLGSGPRKIQIGPPKGDRSEGFISMFIDFSRF